MQTNPVLERNLLALSSCNPGLSAIVGAVDPSPSVTFLTSKTNRLVPAQIVNNNPIPLHSKVDPEREGDRFLSIYQGTGFLVFLGFGAGYHILPFLATSGVSNILIIDKDFRIFRSILENIDIRSIIVDPRVVFLIDKSVSDIAGYILKHYFPVIAGNLKTISLGSRVNLEKEYFHEIVRGIKTIINSIADDYTVQARFGEKWFINTLFNLEKAEQSTVSINASPRIIVTGAGPSLESQMNKVKKIRGNATLIATDTSLPALLYENIKPDIIISIDCQQISYHHFFKGLPVDIPLILDLASPTLLTRLNRNILFFSSGHPFSQYISNNWRKFPFIDTSGGNVSHSAVSLANALGAEEIYLFGIDFSYPEGKTYARGTYLYPYFRSRENRFDPLEKLFLSFIFKNKHLIKEKIGDTFRYTTNQLLSYKERLENAISEYSSHIIHVRGKGLPVSIGKKQKTKQGVNHSNVLLAQGPAHCDWISFLKFYIDELNRLPEPFFPVTKYLSDLSQGERDLWLTLFPAATFLKEYSDVKIEEAAELLKKTIQWTKEKIYRLIGG
ncbi:MAG: motility associated factor glycosyltransferase family protein [Spirochaetales bacterium]|nr:motility associated factor glycosyltransferase family protein [Spirochaetales bacterium]